MKKLIIAATTIAALLGSSAFADDSQSTSVAFSGSVSPTCILTTPTFAGIRSSSTSLNGAGGLTTIALTNLADSATAALNDTSVRLTYSDSYCNYAHSVGIKATNGGLIDSGTSNDPVANSGNFVRRIGYDSAVTWAGGTTPGPNPSTSYSTDEGDSSETTAINTSVAGANRGDMVLDLWVFPDPNPVVSGTYSETLTLKIGATL